MLRDELPPMELWPVRMPLSQETFSVPETSYRVRKSGRLRGSRNLVVLAAFQLTLYLILALAHRSTSDPVGVFGFLGLLGLLFGAYICSALLIYRLPGLRTPQAIRWTLGAAVAFRLVMILAGLPQDSPARGLAADLGQEETGFETFLLFDNDAWRYLWDGALVAQGESPYQRSPLELEELYLEVDTPSNGFEGTLTHLFEDARWVEVYDNLSFTGYRTVYGPLAQGLFALSYTLSPASMLVWKLLLVALEFGGCLILVRIAHKFGRPEALLLYAWNPLVIKEVAGSAHVDGALVFFVLLGFWLALKDRWFVATVAVAGCALVKVSALPLMVLFAAWAWARRGVSGALQACVGGGLTLLVFYLPFHEDIGAIADALATFAAEWMFNPGPWLLVREMASASGLNGWAWANGIGLATLAAILAFASIRALGGASTDADLGASILAVCVATVWLSSTVNPWYLIWALPFAGLLRWWPLLVLTATVCLSYVFYLDQNERTWLLLVEHGLFALSCVAWLLQRHSRTESERKHPSESERA